MPMEATIKKTVEDFVKKEELFTSLDIANTIKRKGIWVRNREVRDWLRNNISDKDIFGDYTTSTISVLDNQAQATLYRPLFSNETEYPESKRDQIPLSPDEVKDIQKKLVGTLNNDAADDINDLLTDNTNPTMQAVIRSKERIKIPGPMIKALGWAPGQTIDPALIKTRKVLSSELKVNRDYRVSIPRGSVGWGTDAVKVMLKDGAIAFDKA